MWDNLIFIDYDVGSFGNSILSLLVTTSRSAQGALEYTPMLSAIGDCHKIRKNYKYSKYEFQLLDRAPLLDIPLSQTSEYVPIIGHSYGKIATLMDQCPDANLIRIVSDRQTFAMTFLAGCSKFTGYPTVDTMDKFYKQSWAKIEHSESGLVECLALNFHHNISTVDWQFYKNATVMAIETIINSDFKSIIKLFEQKFNFVFDHNQVDDFVKSWKTANQQYFDRADKIEQITTAVKTNVLMDISDIDLYEQALVIAFVCFDMELDIAQYPFNDSFNTGWKNTNQIANLIFDLKHTQVR
jgi:hypothetical protein